MNDKLGSYITKLMTTIVDKEQEEFPDKKTEKQLLQEEENGKRPSKW